MYNQNQLFDVVRVSNMNIWFHCKPTIIYINNLIIINEAIPLISTDSGKDEVRKIGTSFLGNEVVLRRNGKTEIEHFMCGHFLVSLDH